MFSRRQRRLRVKAAKMASTVHASDDDKPAMNNSGYQFFANSFRPRAIFFTTSGVVFESEQTFADGKDDMYKLGQLEPRSRLGWRRFRRRATLKSLTLPAFFTLLPAAKGSAPILTTVTPGKLLQKGAR